MTKDEWLDAQDVNKKAEAKKAEIRVMKYFEAVCNAVENTSKRAYDLQENLSVKDDYELRHMLEKEYPFLKFRTRYNSLDNSDIITWELLEEYEAEQRRLVEAVSRKHKYDILANTMLVLFLLFFIVAAVFAIVVGITGVKLFYIGTAVSAGLAILFVILGFHFISR